MQDPEASALAMLQEAKSKGLSYFDAAQSLKAQGFSQEIIDDASNKFDYSQGIVHTPGSQSNSQDAQTEKQELDDELRATDLQYREDRIADSIENLHFGRF